MAATYLVDSSVEVVSHDELGDVGRVLAAADQKPSARHQLQVAHQVLGSVGAVNRHRHLPTPNSTALSSRQGEMTHNVSSGTLDLTN